MFWLKKFVSFWLMPLPLCLTLLALGLVFLLLTRRTRLGRGPLITGVVLLGLFSNKLVSTWLVRPIETTFAAIPEFVAGAAIPAELARCRYVIVLGSGHHHATGIAANNQLSESALARITEAVRLARILPQARLILLGAGEEGYPSHASVLERAALDLGVSPDRIIRIETARDTEDEANAVRRLIGDAPAALVTTAWHLPRSAALFLGAGVDVLPCPTNFTTPPQGGVKWNEFDWDVASLERSTAAVRERLGYAWVWLRRKV